MTVKLRDYQERVLRDLYGAMNEGVRRPLVVCPTGSGKSIVIAELMKDALRLFPDRRVLMLVHVRELVEQNHGALKRAWPDAPASVYCAGLGMKDLSGKIVCASIQSVWRRAYDLQDVGMVVIDEAHLCPPAGDGMYRRMLDAFDRITGGNLITAGFTATPFRLSSGSLVEGEGRVFDRVAAEVGLVELIDGGWLVPPVARQTDTQLDVAGVGTRGGEFVEAQLQAAVDREEITRAAVAELVELGKERRAWLIFTSGVTHAFHVRDMLRREHGVDCEVVHAGTPPDERARILQAFKAGELRAVANDSVLTTGFDAPIVDLIAGLRPTQSAGLWQQMCGRGLRPHEGKRNCLILDYGGNTHRHGPLDLIAGRAKRGKGEDRAPPPVKVCPKCRAIVGIGTRECPDCGHVWPVERKPHAAAAAAAPLLSTQGAFKDWHLVRKVSYARHEGRGRLPSGEPKPATLRVDYWTGLTSYSEWLCFDHPKGSYPRNQAARWWRARAGKEAPVPESVAEALLAAPNLPAPAMVKIALDGRYFRIVEARMAGDDAGASAAA